MPYLTHGMQQTARGTTVALAVGDDGRPVSGFYWLRREAGEGWDLFDVQAAAISAHTLPPLEERSEHFSTAWRSRCWAVAAWIARIGRQHATGLPVTETVDADNGGRKWWIE